MALKLRIAGAIQAKYSIKDYEKAETAYQKAISFFWKKIAEQQRSSGNSEWTGRSSFKRNSEAIGKIGFYIAYVS